MDNCFEASLKRRTFVLLGLCFAQIIILVLMRFLNIAMFIKLFFVVVSFILLVYISIQIFRVHYISVCIEKEIKIKFTLTEEIVPFSEIKQVKFKKGLWNSVCTLKTKNKTYRFYFFDFPQVENLYIALKNVAEKEVK